MKKKLLALLVVLAMVLSIVPAVSAEGSTMAVKVTPSVSTANIGDTVDYTITATGTGITALEFVLVIPEGLSYVANSAAVPSGLRDYLGWGGTDWTEQSMKWTGYNHIPSDFGEDTVILTFSCTVTGEGEHAIVLQELLPFDEGFEEFAADLTVGTVTVGGEEETTTTATEPVPEGSYMNVDVKASATTVNVGDTVDYVIYATGAGITALEFVLVIPEGLSYVANSAVVPSGLRDYLGWGGTDWTEQSMKWTGYNHIPSDFGKDTVILTFSCVAETAGTYEVVLQELLPFDEGFEEFEANLNVDAVTVVGGATECEHSFTNYVSDGNATCTEDGTKTAKCDKCDETKTVVDTGSATGHSFTNFVPNDDATCTGDGSKTAKCDNCDETKTVANDGSATGHSFGEYVADGNATCTADGTKTATCGKCGETDTVADTGSATGHSFTNYVSDGNATCTKNGTETAKCDNCDETNTREAADSATGHNLKKVEATVTCTEAGNIAYYECANCGLLFADATGSIPTDKEAVKSDALGHIDENADKVCDRCGYTEDAPAAKEYCLVGYINGADYGCNDDWQNVGEYVFVNGTLTATFNADSYIFVKTTDNANWYLTESYCTDTTGTFVIGGTEKMFVAGNVAVTFTLVENADGSVTVSYQTAEVPTEPTVPSTEPTAPSTEPTEPSTEPTAPSTEPTEPSTEPTEPSTEPTAPSTEPTEPSTEPTEPTEPSTEPTEPSTEATEPTTGTTEPTTKPGTGTDENPKTDSNGVMLYFAVMMAAAFAVLCAVLLGKKKYVA